MRSLSASIAILALSLPAAAYAKEATPFVQTGAEIDAPRGFREMCRTDDRFCGAAAEVGEPASVPAIFEPAEVPAMVAQAGVGGQFSEALLAWLAPAQLLTRSPESRFASDPARFLTALARQRPPEPVTMLQPEMPVPAEPAAAGVAPADEAALLKSVNRRVNGRVRQRTDERIYGDTERWQQSGTGRDAQGDCEDLAIEKRTQLIAAGFAADRLAFAVVYRRDIGLHTVLIARTSKGDVVLDSRTPYVRSWGKAAYSWVGMQSMRDPSRWHSVTRPELARRNQPKYRTAA